MIYTLNNLPYIAGVALLLISRYTYCVLNCFTFFMFTYFYDYTSTVNNKYNKLLFYLHVGLKILLIVFQKSTAQLKHVLV